MNSETALETIPDVLGMHLPLPFQLLRFDCVAVTVPLCLAVHRCRHWSKEAKISDYRG